MPYDPTANGCAYSLPKRTAVNNCRIFNDVLITQVRIGYFGKPLVTPLPVFGDTPAATDSQKTARAAEWASRLDNEATLTEAADAIRFFEVPDWTLPATDTATKTTADGSTIGTGKTVRSITGLIDDDSEETYAFWNQWSRNPRQVLLWFDSGGHTYGGQDGFEATVLASYKITTDGVAHAWTITISFIQRGDLPRNDLLV